jgi:prephenate dehydrogenase
MSNSRIIGQVRVVGAGLLGSSVGHALRARDIDVILEDASPSALTLAIDYGAGRRAEPGDAPAFVVVAVPPDVTAATVAAELAAWPDALVTDVASVKQLVLDELLATGASVDRYLGSHPLAGRERGGPISARADLFLGRPWVIAEHALTTGAQLRLLEDLVLDVGGVPITMTADEHDRSVALVSHVPQVVASLLARRLANAPENAIALTGQGLRDTTRIAASDPELWVQILGANAPAVHAVLAAYRDDLDLVLAALAEPEASGSRRAVAEAIAGGNAGVARIPGKHGQAKHFSQIVVLVDDTPGELARLLTEIGEFGVNMEDLRLEHSPGAPIGLAEIAVLPEVEQSLLTQLASRGWKIAGALA